MASDSPPEAEARFRDVFVHLPEVVAYARRRGSRDPEAVGVEALTIAWRRLADVPVDDAPPWLFATARNLLIGAGRPDSGQSNRRIEMRRFILLLFVAIALALSVSQASANTTQFVSMTFAEPIHPSVTCPGFPDVSCGAGEVIPLGQATEIVVFAAGCGGTCDLRTIDLPGGSLIAEETTSDVKCRAVPVDCRPGPMEIGSATVTDTLIGGTGNYAGATGTLSGTIRLEGSNARPAGTSTVKLSGAIQYVA